MESLLAHSHSRKRRGGGDSPLHPHRSPRPVPQLSVCVKCSEQRLGASAPHTKRVQSCQHLSHKTLGAEEQVIIVALSPSSPLSWLGFLFFFSKQMLCCLEIEVGVPVEEIHTCRLLLFLTKHREENTSEISNLASRHGKEAEREDGCPATA